MRMLTDVLDDANRKIADLESQLTAIQGERDRLQAELQTLTTSGIIEVAVRNPNVSSYMDQWEGRALKAEAIVDAYAAAARVIGLHLREWMDESLPYDEAIAEAARRVAAELLDNRACNLSTWKQRAESAEAELSAVREALIKVRAHTSYTIPPGYSVEHSKRLMLDLMAGLLASIERIVEAALQPSKEEK